MEDQADVHHVIIVRCLEEQPGFDAQALVARADGTSLDPVTVLEHRCGAGLGYIQDDGSATLAADIRRAIEEATALHGAERIELLTIIGSMHLGCQHFHDAVRVMGDYDPSDKLFLDQVEEVDRIEIDIFKYLFAEVPSAIVYDEMTLPFTTVIRSVVLEHDGSVSTFRPVRSLNHIEPVG